MEQIVIHLLMALKFINLKQKTLKVGNVSQDFSVDNMKKTGFYGYVYDFNVDFSVIAVDDTLDIPKHLMKKNGIKKCLDLLKKCFYSNDDFQLQCIECHSTDVCLDE